MGVEAGQIVADDTVHQHDVVLQLKFFDEFDCFFSFTPLAGRADFDELHVVEAVGQQQLEGAQEVIDVFPGYFRSHVENVAARRSLIPSIRFLLAGMEPLMIDAASDHRYPLGRYSQVRHLFPGETGYTDEPVEPFQQPGKIYKRQGAVIPRVAVQVMDDAYFAVA